MKILIASWTESRVGGAESYLESILRPLSESEHEVACVFETNAHTERSIAFPQGLKRWISSDYTDAESFRKEVEGWSADFVYCHGFLSSTFEDWIQSIAPSIFFAHNYYGTCISGSKTQTFPRTRVCNRLFGSSCLALYLPRGCGGRNPLTMWRDYRAQRERLNMLENYSCVCTASGYMAREIGRHTSRQTQVLHYPLNKNNWTIEQRHEQVTSRLDSFCNSDRPVRLLFLGRIEWNKGPECALDAAALIAQRLDRSVEITFIGEGTLLAQLKQRGQSNSQVNVCWRGWMTGASLTNEIARQDLLLVPSLWPEPFGLVGLEAGLYGIPAASFGLGGIPEWLIDGQTGAITQNNSTTADGLAQAAVSCLRCHESYCALSYKTMMFANQWPDANDHIRELFAIGDSIL